MTRDAPRPGGLRHLLQRWPLVRQVQQRDTTVLDGDTSSSQSADRHPRQVGATPVPSVCPYCATGCGQTIWVRDGRIESIEGDEDSPVSRGRLCPTGRATMQLVTSSQRLDRVHYRAPGATGWSLLELDEAIEMVVDRVLATRERTWEAADDEGRPLNRATGIGLVAGAMLDNEESYLLRKLATSLGVVRMDSQARSRHGPGTGAGLGPIWGRGADTGSLADIANADSILILGSNMAETHAVGFQRVMEAKERGATLIHVDPRFTRTSALADIFAQIRPGTDAVLLCGLIHHVLDKDLFFREFVASYTDGPVLMIEGGSGWDHQRGEDGLHPGQERFEGQDGPATDPSMADPRCVLQILKRNYARYTPAMVEAACGVPQEMLAEIADTLIRNSGPERTSYICIPGGSEMVEHGPQTARSAAILQTLLGNIGRPGGGIMALGGHDGMAATGNLAMPDAADTDLTTYLDRRTPHAGLYGDSRADLVSMLKAWYGDAADVENDFGFHWLPRLTGPEAPGAIEGLVVLGMLPEPGDMSGALQREGLRKLRWMVVRDLTLIGTAEFWRHGPEIDLGEVRPQDIGTEVFVFPAAAHSEKSGSSSNTERRLQWHSKAVEPLGDVRSDLWWIHEAGARIKARLVDGSDPRDDGLRALVWDYSTGADEDPDPRAVLREMNGQHADGRQVASAGELRGDGSTRCGLSITAGAYGPDGNATMRRRPATDEDPAGHEWGWAWPANCRILYNRASARPDGQPWSQRKRLIWWDEAEGRWTGHDVPDFPVHTRPDYRPGPGASDPIGAVSGIDPFIVLPGGKARLFPPAHCNYAPEAPAPRANVHPGRGATRLSPGAGES